MQKYAAVKHSFLHKEDNAALAAVFALPLMGTE